LQAVVFALTNWPCIPQKIMSIRSLLLAAFGLFALHMSAQADTQRVTTPRGAVIEVLAHFPSGAGPFPALVLAPGQGYHLALPALEQTARRLVEQGIAVYRFNWAYFTLDPKAGQPSEDLSNELQDLQTILQLARSDARVAADQLMVGGKSLGSVVAWKALAQDAGLRGGLFLTPVCSHVSQGQTKPAALGDENYPGIAAQQRPLMFISGDRDPLCASPLLLAFASQSGTNTHVAIVGGDHSYANRQLKGDAFEAARDRNIDLVARLSAGFIAEQMGL
jgi:predicted alpha/beta-hydrolase family hydrolase